MEIDVDMQFHRDHRFVYIMLCEGEMGGFIQY